MGLFKAERLAVLDATEAARDGINVSLVVASAAIIIAAVALAVAVSKHA
jgi:hypothetical protein